MTKYFTVFIVCISGIASGQAPALISYTAPVPLLVQCNLFIDTLSEDGSIQLVTPVLKIYRLPVGIFVDSDHSFSGGLPLLPSKLPGIEFRVSFNGTNATWRKLPGDVIQKNSVPFGGLLVDTLIGFNDRLAIEFRDKGSGQIMQRTFFTRQRIIPQIRQYRQKAHTDSVNNTLNSKAVKNTLNPKDVVGFSIFPIETLVLEAGMDVDFLFAKSSVNIDSCIEFRITEEDTDETKGWNATGHLLTIKNLAAGKNYVLHVRYIGLDNENTYRIRTLPFWYQKSWATFLFILVAIVLFILLPYRIYRYRLFSEKQKRLRVEQQLKTVQSQLNPHFVFNALSSIESLVSEGQNEKANEYLNDFSDIMRDTLRNTDLLLISLAEDISMLKKYIRLEQLRFGFHCTIHIDKTLDPDIIDFPPMLLQPSVENAVKHGVNGMGEAGRILISYKKHADDLLITISDNGSKKVNESNHGKGKGMAFTSERIENLKILHKNKSLTYGVSYSASGTEVQFTFENWLS